MTQPVPLTELEAILFDMDGLIVDTEPIHFQAFREYMKKHGVWHEHCKNEVKGRRCGGQIITWYHKNWDRDPVTQLVLPHTEYRVWVCQRCEKEYREPIAQRILFDPDNRQPMISEYSQETARDPYKAV